MSNVTVAAVLDGRARVTRLRRPASVPMTSSNATPSTMDTDGRIAIDYCYCRGLPVSLISIQTKCNGTLISASHRSDSQVMESAEKNRWEWCRETKKNERQFDENCRIHWRSFKSFLLDKRNVFISFSFKGAVYLKFPDVKKHIETSILCLVHNLH